MTRLADLVSEAGATRMIPFDADEFRFVPQGRLSDTLGTDGAPVRQAHLYSLFPTPDGIEWWIDTERHFDAKVAFHPWEGAVVAMGNHEVARPGSRAGEELRILHLSWHSFEQFVRNTRVGATPGGAGRPGRVHGLSLEMAQLRNRRRAPGRLNPAADRPPSGQRGVAPTRKGRPRGEHIAHILEAGLEADRLRTGPTSQCRRLIPG